MASPVQFSTPSPPGTIHTPTTPRHGFGDSWEPFSPRKSARISSRKSSHRTPSPRAGTSSLPSQKSQLPHNGSFSTPATSPQKKRQPTMDAVRRRSGPLSAEDSAQLLTGDRHQKPSAARSHNMLPTPSKTPRKQPNEKAQAEMSAISRNLFSDADALSSTRKRKSKKYSGLTLDSFSAENVEEPIEIFTDSRDRVPVADGSAANPFYNHAEASQSEPTKRRSRRRQVAIPGEGRQAVDEAVQREDGIVYVFRGKKIFRKFSEIGDEDSNESGDDACDAIDDSRDVNAEQPRRSTRSSIKPRLLFPPSEKNQATHEDEEAMTDIEDHVRQDAVEELHGAGHFSLETPDAQVEADTPKAPRYAPRSPPTTTRSTRFSNKLLAEDSPLKRPTKSRSPFDGWRRSKSRAEPHGQKREAEPLPSSSDASKRQRA